MSRCASESFFFSISASSTAHTNYLLSLPLASLRSFLPSKQPGLLYVGPIGVNVQPQGVNVQPQLITVAPAGAISQPAGVLVAPADTAIAPVDTLYGPQGVSLLFFRSFFFSGERSLLGGCSPEEGG